MKFKAWSEWLHQRPIFAGPDGFLTANKDDVVIVVVLKKGEPYGALLDGLLTPPEPAK